MLSNYTETELHRKEHDILRAKNLGENWLLDSGISNALVCLSSVQIAGMLSLIFLAVTFLYIICNSD